MIDTEDKTLSDISELLIATDVKKLGEATVLPDTDERKAKQLPDPSGYRLLCGIPEVDRVTDGGIIKADVTVHHEELLATVLFVIKVGPDAYRDTARFPNGPWCGLPPEDSRSRVSHHQRRCGRSCCGRPEGHLSRVTGAYPVHRRK